MTLMEMAQLLGNFGEFLGMFAVVATLGYLAVQTHSAKEVALAQAQREFIGGLNSVWSRLEQDRELLRLVRIGMNDWRDLKNNEKAAVHALSTQLFSTYSLAVVGQQDIKGIEDFVQSWEDVLLGIPLCPGGKIWWEEAQYLYAPRLVARINARLEAATNLPPSWVEGMTFWTTEDADFAKQ